MKRILLLSFLVFGFVFGEALAQDRSISGKVTSSEDGSTLPGVNVVVKGTTSGTVTDIDGNYKLNVPANGGILVYSFIGLLSQEIDMGSRSIIDVAMATDNIQLQEVVVTALGVTQNAAEVTYANQTVNSEDLMTSSSKNALEALRGKTAGVKITTGSGSVGASTRIVLRGETSLTGNNNALIVVDGIPIDNSSSVGGAQGGEAGFADFGNRFNDFDPNNIASVTILKGPSATSLYGSRGASGVVVITTKSGRKGGLKVSVNSSSSIDEAYVLLQRQDQFGQGLINPDGSNNFDSGENFSWGPRFDGVVRPWTSPIDIDGDGSLEYLSRPYSAVEDQLENFFRTGFTTSNTVSLSGGSDVNTYYVAYGNTRQDGILDNTDYSRHNLSVNSSSKLSDKLTSAIKLNYSFVDQNTTSEGSRAFEGQNAYSNAIQAPTNIPYSELRDYNNPYHGFAGYYGSYTVNPYFVLNEYTNNAKINNVLANLSLNYTPITNLTLSTRLGVNYVSLDRTVAVPVYAYEDHLVWEDQLALTPRSGRQVNAGSVEELLRNTRTIDWVTTGSYSKDVNEDIRATITGGLNYYDVDRRNIFGETQGGLVVPGIYNLANSKDRAIVTQNHSRYRIIGLFGNANFGWKKRVFLDLSARNDWSSSLPVENQSFAYWSVGTSVIVSDFLDWGGDDPINYFKFRASYGTTGKDAAIHLLNSLYTINPTLRDFGDIYQITTPLNGQTGTTRNGLIGNNDLKPELTTTLELGTDISFLGDRIELAYTYYSANSTEQIVEAELARSSGFSLTAVNIGEIQNSGHEISLHVVPLALQNGFKWDLNLTWATNNSEVVKISDQSDDLTIYDSGRGVTLKAEVGQPFGTWKGQVPTFSPAGQQIVDANGSPVYTTDPESVGSIQADWIGGLVNTFSYKGVSLGVVIDQRSGGKFFSLTKSATEFNGTSLTTLIGDRQPFVVPNSVIDNGDGTFTENTKTILADAFVFDGNYTKNVLDGSFVKLREVTLGYTLPRSILSKIKLQGASVKLFAKNPKYWFADENTFGDSEVNGPAGPGNIQGVESSQTPISKSYGINLNLTF